jgi:hypothetical protein
MVDTLTLCSRGFQYTHRCSGARGKAGLYHFLHHFLHDRLIRFLLRLDHDCLPLFGRELPKLGSQIGHGLRITIDVFPERAAVVIVAEQCIMSKPALLMEARQGKTR